MMLACLCSLKEEVDDFGFILPTIILSELLKELNSFRILASSAEYPSRFLYTFSESITSSSCCLALGSRSVRPVSEEGLKGNLISLSIMTAPFRMAAVLREMLFREGMEKRLRLKSDIFWEWMSGFR